MCRFSLLGHNHVSVQSSRVYPGVSNQTQTRNETAFNSDDSETAFNSDDPEMAFNSDDPETAFKSDDPARVEFSSLSNAGHE